MIDTNLLNSELQNLIGKEVWGIVGGKGSGSVISLKIGEKTKSKTPSKNKHLSKLVRNYDSEFTIMIYSPWRIENQDNVICGSHHNNDENGPYQIAFNMLLNNSIKNIHISKPGLDLTIEFNNGYSLKIFCALIGMDENDCYSIESPKGWFIVKFDGGIELDSGV
ncbi:hypothetical protein [Shewanella youngdeokensis]|uniref:Uncharacterized protein n=1 Tax=Shewanella youngdeokensis TaxID=2999068 RepID=A0ABZ0JVR4_9GAMM|nr:hypothetical protein RGE70_11480 [Shewanella sp. DAU334]